MNKKKLTVLLNVSPGTSDESPSLAHQIESIGATALAPLALLGEGQK